MSCPHVLRGTSSEHCLAFPRHHRDIYSRQLMQYRNGRQRMVSSLQPRSKVIHFTAPRSRVHRPPAIRIGNIFLPVEESTKFLGLWWDLRLSFKKHTSVLKTQCREALNLIRVVAHLKWGGDRYAFDAVPGHCTLQAGLRLHCVWHGIEYHFTTTGQHSQLWIETGIGSILYQPKLQPVHRGH